jgi:hypothetical protein
LSAEIEAEGHSGALWAILKRHTQINFENDFDSNVTQDNCNISECVHFHHVLFSLFRFFRCCTWWIPSNFSGLQSPNIWTILNLGALGDTLSRYSLGGLAPDLRRVQEGGAKNQELS